MTHVITKEILQKAVDMLNRVAHTTEANRFEIEWLYNRPALNQCRNVGTGENTIIQRTTKGDLFDKVHILVAGIEYGQRNK